MPFLRALVTIPSLTTVPEDACSNTWHFDVDNGTPAAAADECHNALTTFYQTVDGYLNGGLLGTTATVRYYDLEDAEPRVPVHTETIALTLAAAATMPSEVAAVMSFQGAVESGVNMRRRRGRIYLGPLTSSALSGPTGGRVSMGSAFRTAVANAATSVLSYVGTLGVSWAVYSPTTRAQGGTLDESFEDVVSGWIDDAIDTQRRRGTTAQTRTTF